MDVYSSTAQLKNFVVNFKYIINTIEAWIYLKSERNNANIALSKMLQSFYTDLKVQQMLRYMNLT